MSISLKAPMALGFILAIPLLAVPARGAPVAERTQKPAHYEAADFAKAQALVSTRTPTLSMGETDGLGRNDAECNMGCVDH